MSSDGFFISLEGVEGAGKSTQARLLAEALRTRGRQVLETREPGGTAVGEELRHVLKHAREPGELCPETELLLMCASRAQLLHQVIRPFLAHGGIVVCDRFADSTTVYQGCARGLDPDFIARVHAFVTGGRWPDLTLLLDLDVQAGLRRALGRTETGRPTTDRFEAESAAFHQRVRRGFLDLAAQQPDRFRVIPADRPADAIHQHILHEVLHALG